MSQLAVEEFQSARVDQTTQNDARRIRTRVEAAQQGPARAGVRWPFELLQNAHDAGPREGQDNVEVDFVLRLDNLVVSHTGKPFNPQELAALLSGGSSKEFDGEETTGRFGTGFLVTHALSTRVDVNATLATDAGHERFSIELIRDGDESAIVENIESANQSLLDAETISQSWIDANPSASFTYYRVNPEVAESGLARLREALPYLFATCENLGRVSIEASDQVWVLQRTRYTDINLQEFTLREVDVEVRGSTECERIKVIRIGVSGENSTILTALNLEGENSVVSIPHPGFSRLFVKFPIAGTSFLPFNFVIEGGFTPQQERDGIHMNSHDRELIESALSSLPVLVKHGIDSGWHGAHMLASLAKPERSLSGEESSGELEWWFKSIQDVARSVAEQAIVRTVSGLMPAVNNDDGDIASFLVPSVDAEKEILFDYEHIHDLAVCVDGLNVPEPDVAAGWSSIAQEWDQIGIELDRLGLEELTDRIKTQARQVEDIPIQYDPYKWLVQLLWLISELRENFTVDPLMDGLLPDLEGILRDREQISIDGGIAETIKDISAEVGINLRSELLNGSLLGMADQLKSPSVKRLLHEMCGETYFESTAIERILSTLETQLPVEQNVQAIDSANAPYLAASAKLISYLETNDDVQSLRRCPLLTAEDTMIQLSGTQQVLAPVSFWPESCQDFADLYTKRRILSERYFYDDELQQALTPLISTRLVIGSPLFEATRAEITDANLLNAMSRDGDTYVDIAVRNASFSQIAFLSTDLVNRSGRDPEIAKRLMEFVLTVAAKEDPNWREFKEVTGNVGGEQIRLELRGAVWPYELKVRSWVPIPISEESEQQGYAPAPANENYIREIYDSAQFKNSIDAIDLLHEVFGIKRITLMLETLDSDTESDLEALLADETLVGSAVRHQALLKTADEKPEVARLISEMETEEVEDIRQELEERRRRSGIREGNRNFGHAVQDALKQAIETRGLELELVDRGYDYEVFPGSLDGGLDEVPFSFKLGSYFLEVKATTTGDVRLTPLQAKTAAQHTERFVLGEIDLRGQEIKESWKPSDVEPFARIVTGIGSDVENVYEFVEMLTGDFDPVRLRNEDQLRYALNQGLWENGLSIDDWVETLKSS